MSPAITGPAQASEDRAAQDRAAQDRAAEDWAAEQGIPSVPGPVRRPRWFSVLRVLIMIAALAGAALLLRGRLPAPHEIAEAARTADPRWLIAAGVAEAISLGMFARQQRRLLRAFGIHMSLPRALAVTYSRSAISVSVPAGPAVSAGFAYQQFRVKGASRPVAATVMILSGAASFVGLVLLYAGGALGLFAARARGPWSAAGFTVVVLVIAMAAGLLRRRPQRSEPPRRPSSTETSPADGGSRYQHGRTNRQRVRAALLPLRNALIEARAVPTHHWVFALGAAVLNWLTDLICLALVARAFALPVGWVPIASIYLAVQFVRQLPLTPGGVGLIETSLLTGLISAGAQHAPAAATVLGYRLFSCWLLIPLGFSAWLALRRLARDKRTARLAGPG